MLNQRYPKLPFFIQLMRLDRPIGILLLLWPTLWALWIAGEGQPDFYLIIIFTLGVILMRSAGCVINDIADRNLDGLVERTKERPLPSNRVSPKEALILFIGLAFIAFILVLFVNRLTIYLSFGGIALATLYPFMKRHTYLPQVFLGAAFAWAIPMAFAAQTNTVAEHAWLLYLSTLIWTVAYDTLYAMVDRDDDIKAGIKSTAILFGDGDRLAVGILQLLSLWPLYLLGQKLQLNGFFYFALLIVAGLFIYQQWLIKERDKERCLKAFLNNNWVGAAIFSGIFFHYVTN